jgi:hypothetical protein
MHSVHDIEVKEYCLDTSASIYSTYFYTADYKKKLQVSDNFKSVKKKDDREIECL